jgi:hypothetical protein
MGRLLEKSKATFDPIATFALIRKQRVEQAPHVNMYFYLPGFLGHS